MSSLSNALIRLQNRENLKEILLDTIYWVESQLDVNDKLLDELLKISAVTHLVEMDAKTGKILPGIRKKEIEHLTQAVSKILAPGNEPQLTEKTKLLFISANPMEALIANPGDPAIIQAAEEYKDIEESIRYHQMLESMPLQSIFEASFTELSESLNAGDISILHFSNHGDENGIILNKGDGFKEHVGAGQLSGLLKITHDQNTMKLLFLNSCNSYDLANSIHKDHPTIHFISHAKKVPSDLVREFAAYFYRLLAQEISNKGSTDAYIRAFNLALNKFSNLKGISHLLQAKTMGK